MANLIHNFENLFSIADCAEIVRRDLNIEHVNVIEYNLKPTSNEIVGFLGEYFYLTIKTGNNDSFPNDKTKTYSYFIKSLPILNQQHKNMLIESGIFAKEVFMYETLFKEFDKYSSQNVWHPKCFLTRPDVLVLENLLQYGYSHVKDDQAFTPDQMESALSILADMHAASIIYEVKSGQIIGNLYKDRLYETSIMDFDWFNNGLRSLCAVAEVHPKYQSKNYQHFIKGKLFRILQNVYEMVEPSRKFRNVLCHRDVWRKNIMMKKNVNQRISSILVDFQICRYSPPIVDVLLCIYLNIERKDQRKLVTEKYLSHYHKWLENELKKSKIDINNHIPWSEFKRSYYELLLLPTVYRGIVVGITNFSQDFLQDLRKYHPDEYIKFTDKNRADFILKEIKINNKFKELMFDTVEELVDLVYVL